MCPFHLISGRLDLIGEHDRLISDIRAQIGVEMPAVIALDTLNRTLTGSENSDEDMSAYVQAADAIREAFGCVVVVIHHCGIEATRPRGHTSLLGAADAQIAVRRDGEGQIHTVVERMKDGREDAETHSRLDVVVVGHDTDTGAEITSCVVEAVDAQTERAASGPKLTPNQQTMLSILIAAGKGGLSVEDWNERAKAEGVGLKRKADLYDLRDALRSKKLVYQYNERWYVSAPKAAGNPADPPDDLFK